MKNLCFLYPPGIRTSEQRKFASWMVNVGLLGRQNESFRNLVKFFVSAGLKPAFQKANILPTSVTSTPQCLTLNGYIRYDTDMDGEGL